MPKKPKPLIVIVEDQEDLANLIASNLEQADMDTQVCTRASWGERFLKDNFANLILLDLNLPDQSGFSLFESLRQKKIDVPVIFLTGNDSEIQKVKGLEMGGDDYMTKPFSFSELIARIHAVLRRAEVAHDLDITQNVRLTEEPFQFCGVIVNPTRMEMTYPDGETLKIGKKELGILDYLSSNQGVVISRKSLIHAVWGIHADVRSRSLDQYIVKIRERLQDKGMSLEPFRTIHGVGYLYDPENQIATPRKEVTPAKTTPKRAAKKKRSSTRK